MNILKCNDALDVWEFPAEINGSGNIHLLQTRRGEKENPAHAQYHLARRPIRGLNPFFKINFDLIETTERLNNEVLIRETSISVVFLNILKYREILITRRTS